MRTIKIKYETTAGIQLTASTLPIVSAPAALKIVEKMAGINAVIANKFDNGAIKNKYVDEFTFYDTEDLNDNALKWIAKTIYVGKYAKQYEGFLTTFGVTATIYLVGTWETEQLFSISW